MYQNHHNSKKIKHFYSVKENGKRIRGHTKDSKYLQKAYQKKTCYSKYTKTSNMLYILYTKFSIKQFFKTL
jgi:hypothetical protein